MVRAIQFEQFVRQANDMYHLVDDEAVGRGDLQTFADFVLMGKRPDGTMLHVHFDGIQVRQADIDSGVLSQRRDYDSAWCITHNVVSKAPLAWWTVPRARDQLTSRLGITMNVVLPDGGRQKVSQIGAITTKHNMWLLG
jgi:hypothetical protein